MTERLVARERQNRYGDFVERARVTQNITAAMADSRNWKTLAPDTRQCFEEIAIKIGRALNGDAEYADNFTDIIGLARHVERRLKGERT